MERHDPHRRRGPRRLPRALLLLLGVLLVAEYITSNALAGSNALECWPRCTAYEDMIRVGGILVLPVAIVAVLITTLVVGFRRSRRR